MVPAATVVGMSSWRRLTALGLIVVVGTTASACAGGSDGASPRTIVELPDAQPGDVIALRASDTDPSVVEWIDRRAGTVRSVDVEGGDVALIATIAVGTDGEQRGLLGHAVIDGVRYAAWTDPDTEHLLVGAIDDRGVERIVWDGGGTAGGAVGGHLDATADGRLLLGIGQLTDWAEAHGSGALVELDPVGPPDQEPTVITDGYINPFAFVVDDSRVWVADNAVGDDTERIGRGDLDDRADLTATGTDPRAPSAIVVLADDDLAVCGFLDGQLRRWTIDPPGYADPLGPCLTGVVVLADGTIVTATADSLAAITP